MSVKMKNLTVLATYLGATLAFPPGHHGPHGPPVDGLTVSTSSGRAHGKIDPSLPNVRQFLGIPYAVPPVGSLRWTAPQLLDEPDAEVDATQLPVSCMQYLSNQGNSLYVRDVLQFNLQGLNTTGATSENCLTVSVWTPTSAPGTGHGWQGEPSWRKPGASTGAGLPVLIFIYGGGFQTGGEDVPYQIPAQWVDRAPDHIVVSFNYRLNIFGFPEAAGLSGSQNFGLLDQRAVVEWCQMNIAAFGGDPDRMVIWGQSAGAASVDLYNFAYPDDPIVTGLIMDSGTVYTSNPSFDQTYSNFTFVANHVGCGDLASDPEKQLACMRAVDAGTIEDFVATYAESGTTPALSFNPIADGIVAFANYTERALAGLQADIPAIIGTNDQDGVPFAPYNPNGPNQTIVLEALLRLFFCPSTESIRLRQETGRLTYRYLYAGNFSNISPRPWMGAYHSSELPLLMGTHPDFRAPSTELEYGTSEAFQDAYVAFARDPTSGLQSQDWTPYAQLGAGNVREFGAGVAAQDISIADTEALCDEAAPAPGV